MSITRGNPGVSFDATMHSRSKIHDVGDHSKLNAMFQSPFIGGSSFIPQLPVLFHMSTQKGKNNHVIMSICLLLFRDGDREEDRSERVT